MESLNAPVYASTSVKIGPRLKAARRKKALSLRALGEKTDFSASFLSQVELGQASPSLTSLETIVRALGLRLVDLLQDEDDADTVVVRRRDANTIRSEYSKAEVQSLLPSGADPRLGAQLLVIEPGGHTGRATASAGVELAFCVRGKVELQLGSEKHALGEGDSAYFNATTPRRWSNVSKRRAEILIVALR